MRPILVLLLLLPLAYSAINFVDDSSADTTEATDTTTTPDESTDTTEPTTTTTSSDQPTDQTTTTAQSDNTTTSTNTTSTNTTDNQVSITTPQGNTTSTTTTTTDTTTEEPTSTEEAATEPTETVTTTTTTTPTETTTSAEPTSTEEATTEPAATEEPSQEPTEASTQQETAEITPLASNNTTNQTTTTTTSDEEPASTEEQVVEQPTPVTETTTDTEQSTSTEEATTTTTTITNATTNATTPDEQTQQITPISDETETTTTTETPADSWPEASTEEATDQITPNTEDQEAATTTEEYIQATTTNQTNNTQVTIITPKTVTGDAPKIYGGLLLPHVRANTSFNVTTNDVCGGTVRDKVHFITTQNIDTEFKWYIETPIANSYCLFRISENIDQANETAYVTLKPVGRTDIKPDGWFPCGKTSGAEFAYFDIPDDIDCDACILEWIWSGPNFQLRQCADITVIGGDDVNCLGQCQNGGICKRGECVCPEGYSGSTCESVPGAVASTAKKILAIIFFILLGIILILLLILCLYYCARQKIDSGEKTQIYHTNRKYNQFDDEINSIEMRNRGLPAEHIKPDANPSY